MDLSVLIVNWNTRDFLEQCLQSVRDTAKEIRYEIIVVDNASHDKSAAMVREAFPEVNLVACTVNLGFAKGNNLAYSRSSGEYVLLLNPDVTLLDGTLKGLLDFARTHPDAGMISPKLLNPDRTVQTKYYGRIPTLSTIFFIYTHLGSAMDTRLLGSRFRRRERYNSLAASQEALSFTDGGAAFCCTLVPRNLIEQHGFLDERFPVFFNDGDFAFRLFQEGYKAYVLPRVHACHHGGASVAQLDAVTYDKEFLYGLRTYSRKHRGRLYAFAVDSLLGLNLLDDLQRSGLAVMARRKPLRTLLEPVTRFREMLAYRPSNAE